jgi:hypothetical protein
MSSCTAGIAANGGLVSIVDACANRTADDRLRADNLENLYIVTPQEKTQKKWNGVKS